MKLKAARFIAAIAAASTCLSSPSIAEMPDLSFLAGAERVSDEELGEIRGRFAAGNGITYFGVTLLTLWQTGSGELMTAGLEFNSDMLDAGHLPVATFGFATPATFTADGELVETTASPGMVTLNVHGFDPAGSTPDGLSSVSGVVQSILAGGALNDVDQSITINATDDPGDLVSVSSEIAAAPARMAVDGTMTLTFQDGMTATVFAEANQLGLVVEIDGLGSVSQRIGGGQAGQFADLTSSANFVRQDLSIDILISPSATIRDIAGATDLVRGLPGS